MPSANSTADRAIEILLMFDDEHPVRTAAEVAERFEMPRSTTYRYLSSLRSNGLLVDAGESGFRLGPRIFQLARVARRGYSVLQLAEPELRHLAAVTGETVLLAQLNGLEISVLECIESAQQMRISYSRGQTLPTPAGASAKVFLAFGEPRANQAVMRRRKFVRYTDNTITEPAQLAKELEQVKAQGYALNQGEIDEGVSGLAAPVLSADGYARYAITVVAPSFRLTRDRLTRAAREVQAAAKRISRAMADVNLS